MAKTIIAAAASVLAVVAILGYFMVSGASVQAVTAGNKVSVYYTGSFANGTVFDSNIGRGALNFTVGAGQMISGFDSAVVGMRLNQTKSVTLSPAEAYGEPNPALVVQVPLSRFGNNSSAIKIGEIITASSKSGQPVQGRVTSISSDNATIDFNPPLAGKTLKFEIKVVGIQKQ